MEQIKTLEERENSLILKGKEKGFITYEELAQELKGLDIDNDALDNLYNKLVENNIAVVAEADVDTTTGEVDGKVKVVLKTTTKNGHKYLKNTNFIVKDGEDAIYSSTITKTTLKSENIKLKKTSYY